MRKTRNVEFLLEQEQWIETMTCEIVVVAAVVNDGVAVVAWVETCVVAA